MFVSDNLSTYMLLLLSLEERIRICIILYFFLQVLRKRIIMLPCKVNDTFTLGVISKESKKYDRLLQLCILKVSSRPYYYYRFLWFSQTQSVLYVFFYATIYLKRLIIYTPKIYVAVILMSFTTSQCMWYFIQLTADVVEEVY